MMRFLICDDHPLVRRALRSQLVENWPGCTVEEAQDFLEACEKISAGFDLCITDLLMPGEIAVEGLRALVSKAAETPVVVLSGSLSAMNEGDILTEIGALKVLSKQLSNEALLEEIAEALRTSSTRELKKKAKPLSKHFSPQQVRIANLIAAGKSNKEIAIALDINPATVKSHVETMLRKIGAKSRLEIAGKVHLFQRN